MGYDKLLIGRCTRNVTFYVFLTLEYFYVDCKVANNLHKKAPLARRSMEIDLR